MRLSASMAVWSHWSPISASAGSDGSQCFCFLPTNDHFSSNCTSLTSTPRTCSSCSARAWRPSRIATLVTPSLEAPVSRDVPRIPQPSFRCSATETILSCVTRALNSAVPRRSENSTRHVEHRRIRHSPPPLPVRTDRLPHPRLPLSGHFGLTQHSSRSGRCSGPRPASGCVRVALIAGPPAPRARGPSPGTGIRQENRPMVRTRPNRRTSRNRGLVFRRLLEQAVVTEPVTEAAVTHGYGW